MLNTNQWNRVKKAIKGPHGIKFDILHRTDDGWLLLRENDRIPELAHENDCKPYTPPQWEAVSHGDGHYSVQTTTRCTKQEATDAATYLNNREPT